MSHFTVLVIGDDVEEALAPFHEFECTGHDDQYVQDVDITDDIEDDDLEDHGLENSIVEAEHQVDRSDVHKFGYAIVSDGKLVKAVRRTNPNAQWDWWVEGGRWSGMILNKAGERVNSAIIGDIDFATMRSTAAEKAEREYNEVHEIIDGREVLTFEQSVDRDAFWSQPVIEDLKKAFGVFFRSEPFTTMTRDQYISREANSVLQTFAVVKDGVWYEKGSMGWWGCVSDEKSDWPNEFKKLVESLPDSETITIVDCHI